MEKFKVIISEKMDDCGIELLKKHFDVDVAIGISREDLLAKIHEYDALIVRSVTDVNAELMDKATKLKIIGRAGNGTDNIRVEEATKRGIIVCNTPESNTISAGELAIGLMLDGCRDISYADKHLKAGNWDRNKFEGTELYGKTLGIIGLGKIGSIVATRMKAFGMTLIAYDPYITDSRFEKFGCRKVTLDELLKESDIITLHTPKTAETTKMLSDEQIAKMKDGVRLVNAARGSLIDEEAAYKGLKSGKIASLGLDVHDKEPRSTSPLYEFNSVTVTPHIGANTKDAQFNVGKVIAEQVIAGLKGEIVSTAVNLPAVDSEELKTIKPYVDLSEKLGKFYYQMNKEKVQKVEISYWGQITKNDTSLIGLGFLKGLLTPIKDSQVNYINAKVITEELGIGFVENSCSDSYNNFSSIIKFKITNNLGEKFTLAGTLAANGEGRLVEINGYEVDVTPYEHILYIQNNDVPGVIGEVGTLVGEANVNVATMHVGRKVKGDTAIMLLNIDNSLSKETLAKFQDAKNIIAAKVISL